MRESGDVRQLNFDLKGLQEAPSEGSFGTRRARSFALAQAADTLHELGFRRLRATGLKGKHVEALVAEWRRQGLSIGTIKNRMAAMRWWAKRIGKPGVVRSQRELRDRGTPLRDECGQESRTAAGQAGPGEGRACEDGAQAAGGVRPAARGGDQVLPCLFGPRREDRAEGVDHQGRPGAGDPRWRMRNGNSSTRHAVWPGAVR